MKRNQKNGILMSIAISCNNQWKRKESKNVNQKSAAAYRKMYFLVLAVIAARSTVPYSVLFSVSNDNMIT